MNRTVHKCFHGFDFSLRYRYTVHTFSASARALISSKSVCVSSLMLCMITVVDVYTVVLPVLVAVSVIHLKVTGENINVMYI